MSLYCLVGVVTVFGCAVVADCPAAFDVEVFDFTGAFAGDEVIVVTWVAFSVVVTGFEVCAVAPVWTSSIAVTAADGGAAGRATSFTGTIATAAIATTAPASRRDVEDTGDS